MTTQPDIPIDVVHLLPVLDKKLIDLLKSLMPDEWQKQTIAKLWTVKDVAAHLLDSNIWILSIFRDNYYGEQAKYQFLSGLDGFSEQAQRGLS